jgi:nucleolin
MITTLACGRLTNRETGEFKGCGFIEFWETGPVDKVVLKNGEDLLGRQVRIDYAGTKKDSW